MQSTDIQSVYSELTKNRAIPVSFATVIAEETGINETSVRACLNGNNRVYISDAAKNQILNAAIRILSEKAVTIQDAVAKLQQIAA